MKKIIRVSESDLVQIIKSLINEQQDYQGQQIKRSINLDRAPADTTYVKRKLPINSFDQAFNASLANLEKTYSCIPKMSSNVMGGKKIKPVSSEMRKDIFMTIFFIGMVKKQILSIFNCDEKTLVFLFKLALAAMDQQTGLGTTYQSNEQLGRNMTKFDSSVSSLISDINRFFGGDDVYVDPAMTLGKAYQKYQGSREKEASIGPYQMHPSNFAKATGTQQITGLKAAQTTKLYSDLIASTLAVMEYFLNNYRKIKTKNGFAGPSVDFTGKPINGMSGDYNWDISIASYAFDFDGLLSQKFCKTEDAFWPAPCTSAPEYRPTQDTINRRVKSTNVPTPKRNPLTVYGNQVIKNYLPILTIGSDTTEKYVKWYMNYVNSTLSCLTSFQDFSNLLVSPNYR